MAVLKTSKGTILFTMGGAYTSTPDSSGNAVLASSGFTNFNALVKTFSSVVSAAKIPSTTGYARYLLFNVMVKAQSYMYTYDATTDTYFGDILGILPTTYMIYD